jgi:phage FluMu protein Com
MIDVRCKFCRHLLFQADEALTGRIVIKCKRSSCRRLVDYTFEAGRSIGERLPAKNTVALSSAPR